MICERSRSLKGGAGAEAAGWQAVMTSRAQANRVRSFKLDGNMGKARAVLNDLIALSITFHCGISTNSSTGVPMFWFFANCL